MHVAFIASSIFIFLRVEELDGNKKERETGRGTTLVFEILIFRPCKLFHHASYLSIRFSLGVICFFVYLYV